MTAPFNQNECPICMDDIIGLSNRVTTECGHTFHCSCLMQNAAHNGFGCPYCRTTMAEIPDDSDLDSDDSITISSFYNDEEDEFLTSFRMFHQQLNGQEVEEEETADSDADSADSANWSTDSDSDEEEGGLEEGELVEGVIVEGRFIEGGVRRQPVIREGQPVIREGQPVEEGGVRGPPPVIEADSAHITQKLMERGITFEDLVKTILFHEHDNYLDRYAHHERRSSEIYGQFKAVMSRFRNEQTRRPNPIPIPNPNPVVQNPIPILNPIIPIPLIPVPNTLEAKTITLSHTEITIHNNNL